MVQKKIGIISGSGALPGELVESCIDLGLECCVAMLDPMISSQISSNIHAEAFTIGSVQKIVDYFNSKQVSHIVFIGKVKRPNLNEIKVDGLGAKLVSRIVAKKILGDDSVLQIIAKFFEDLGFIVISPQEITTYPDFHTRIQPSNNDLDNISLGKDILDVLGEFDVGQSVIIYNGQILGIEGAEGTDELINRCSVLRNSTAGGVLVKMMKSFQDKRMDIPTIGPDTVDNIAKHGYSGIAIHKDKVIITSPRTTLDKADAYGIFIAEI